MSMLFRDRRSALTDYPQFGGRSSGRKAPRSTAARAHSAVWAATRVRGDLISTLPVDAYQTLLKVQIETAKPPVLKNPGGEEVDILEWIYSSQGELDMCGNSVGLITEVDGNGMPARIDLQSRERWSIKSRNGVVTYMIDGKAYDRSQVWHERQFTMSGVAVGLSPVVHAALTLYQSAVAQEFASAWFGGQSVPSGILRFTGGNVLPADADAHRARFKLAIENGDPFVAGRDWDYKPIEAMQAQGTFIETMGLTDVEICRFFGVPADLIDAAQKGSSVTYANITQRNLQLLIVNLGPAIIRRETALSKLLPGGKFVKFNTDALLRMDPETVSRVLGQQVKDRLITVTEAREKLNRGPYTPAQVAEFETLFPKGQPAKAITTGA